MLDVITAKSEISASGLYRAGWSLSRMYAGGMRYGSSQCERQTNVNGRSIKSDLARIDRMKDSDIDYSDIPQLDDEFFARAKQVWPPAKLQLTIRLDADVLEWLKSNGRGYQTRINRILRAAMETQPRRRPASKAVAAPRSRAKSKRAS
jgi:uncharacterized protein (DUF4415 family)